MPAPPCKPNCTCGKHIRTNLHNQRIAASVKKTLANKRSIDQVNKFKVQTLLEDTHQFLWYPPVA